MRYHRPKWKLGRLKPHELALACAAVFTLTVAGGLAPRVPGFVQNVSVPAFGTGAGYTARIARVIDGDTVETENGERIRVLNIDAAEMPPHAHCALEEHLALAAKARVVELVAQAHEVTLAGAGDRDRDMYGRQLRLVHLDGEDLGGRLVREGLAQPWRGHHASWC